MFSSLFPFLWIYFFAFFLFSCVVFSFFRKMTEKKRKFPTLRYERIIYACYCVIIRKNYLRLLLRHYTKELFAFVLRSQHSLDIFWLGGAERGSLFLVTLLFLHRNKKVKGPIRYKLKQKKTYIYYYVCFRLFQNKFTRQWWYCNRRLHLYKFYGVFWKLPLT